jgi:Family of unknown function (DUF6183)
MVDQIQEILTTLPGRRDLSEIYEATGRRLAAGDAAFVADLGIALHSRATGADQVRQFRRAFAHVLRLLAVTPGRENVEQVLRLLTATGGRHVRYVASVLASSQAPGDLAVIFADGTAHVGGPRASLRNCARAWSTKWCFAACRSRTPGSPAGRHRRTGAAIR